MGPEASENPFREGLRSARTSDPCVFVLFGARGDLATRKILPSICSLARKGLLPSSFALLGVGRKELSDEAFREELRPHLLSEDASPAESGEASDPVVDALLKDVFYRQFNTDDERAAEALALALAQIDRERGTRGNRLFYLSTPPSAFAPIIQRLSELRSSVGQLKGERKKGACRIVVEKPFGYDLEGARELNRTLLDVFDESEVYRIDHFLGKETVQNVLVLRFANAIFEPLWNRRYIDNVQIAVAEKLGVEGRGGYYEDSGALRDMVQNHLLQLLCLVAMEPPAALDAEALRDERTKVLRSIRRMSHDEVGQYAVRGQYGPGSLDGKSVPGYRQEETVSKDSRTETYAALRLEVDNWRWAGVPFYLRTGKRLPKKVSEVAIEFKDIPHRLFDKMIDSPASSNVLALRISPDEGISLKFESKVPGRDISVRSVKMDFQYGTSFGDALPEAYERLVLDALLGDPTLFIRGDVSEEAWRLMMPILEVWEDPSAGDPPLYDAGSFGPDAASALLEVDGRSWRRL